MMVVQIKPYSIIKKKFKNNKKVKIVSYNKNMGKGYALKRGVQIAKNDLGPYNMMLIVQYLIFN